MALDQVESSLPDGASAAYEHALLENEEGLTALLEQEGHLWLLEGTVLNVFTQQGGKDKDRWSVCWSWQGTNFRCYGSA